MNFIPTELPGVILIEPKVFRDERGFFLETYHAAKFAQAGLDVTFVQDNHSRSVQGTLRGLHAQWRRPQGKLVRVIAGEIFDVVVDIRLDSPTFGRWLGVRLSAENFRQLYVPQGFVHGFCVVSDMAEVLYKCTALYDPGDEIGVIWNDPEIGIDWGIESPLLSEKDRRLPTLRTLVQQLQQAPDGV
ncbi:dTDP-4-dehydrorhamnose 3,5-epimerase [Chloracidobacterium thermophilum]|jgi:dTDP-4-dehydrorhamnose 3,5-epimerase|uniref:dTDP-4-dehydrorhamnose 3,5-epimerase n=1 Tax=Chloracidobacterium thermophilum (strain B) TaxID=981222 RepID=G2LDF3_CHLTF|nr:dTDP-4-dehydrorhamnose 3,5-epimerase [Chloracidobacterium thermophilum]AEP12413.1 dTDP-4-dehydrorhamnose 3,5-epimerase [Chloracidobacterium thermophilum B]QUV78167.1 dTDP-4-dehydrorhamnose 3,5-epimerase [Chloracidobacterium thermophilum]